RTDPEPPDRPALAPGAHARGSRVRPAHAPALARDRPAGRTGDRAVAPIPYGGEPARGAVRSGRLRRRVRRLDVPGVLVRAAVRGQRGAHGPGAVLFGSAPGALVDRVGMARHPDRPAPD